MRADILAALRSLREARHHLYDASNTAQDASRDHLQNDRREDAIEAAQASGGIWEVTQLIDACGSRLRRILKGAESVVDDPYA
jgi:hypothetical protein